MSTESNIESLEARLKNLESAVEKLGIRRCEYSGGWFKLPEDGMHTSAGRPFSWEGLADYLAEHPGCLPKELPAGTLCERLMSGHGSIIETVLRDRLARPCGVSKLAAAMGLRYPMRESKEPFLSWLRSTGRLR